MLYKILAVIPARGGSKRIPNKNIRLFNGKPLIAHTIGHALKSKIFDKVIVDTDSPEIAKLARKYGAEVPFLRPEKLARDGSKIGDVIEFLLKRLKREQGYLPDIICLLQTTSPLREKEDIDACYGTILGSGVKSVCTVCETSPWFYHLTFDKKLNLVNKKSDKSTNTQDVARGYILNGCMVYMVKTAHFLKTKKFVDKDTHGVVCPKWRSVDLDHPEDWVLAEFLHKNKDKIHAKLSKF